METSGLSILSELSNENNKRDNMEKQYNPDGFIPKHGGYKSLLTFQKAEIIFDGTVYFCRKYFQPRDRTIDQMVQAARSGKQNIVEGSMASGTSKEMEIKLTNVARASLEELLNDYKDFLRTRNLTIWDKIHPYYSHLTKLLTAKSATYETYRKGIESPDPEVSANVMIGLINITSYLLAKQLKTLESEFLQEGGLRERMSQARIDVRRNLK
jgi:four helix bundle suffix protein